MGNEKLKKQHKLLYIFMLLLGQLTLFLMLSPEDSAPQIRTFQYPDNHITIVVNASLKTELDPKLPIMLSDSRRTFVVKPAFVLKQIQKDANPIDYIGDNIVRDKTSFLVSVPKENAEKLLNTRGLVIYPYMPIKLSQRKKDYEIHY